jgi:hypothetical protein
MIPAARFGPTPVTSRRRDGSCSIDFEHRITEGAHELLRIYRADPADHTGAEILLDAFGCGWRRNLEKRRLELHPVRPVVDPATTRLKKLAGRDHGGMPKDGYEIARPRALTRSTQKPFSGL